MNDRKVIVDIKCVIQQHSRDGVFAARFPALGLTGYGATEDEAINSFKVLYKEFINAYRSKGRLSDILNRAGVNWWWVDEPPPEHSHEVERQAAPIVRPMGAAEEGIVYSQFAASILKWSILSERDPAHGEGIAAGV